MKLIRLGTKGYAIIDAKDWPRASLYSWYKTRKGYARRWLPNGKSQLLHNFIMGFVGVDHANRNPLDCRKSNLRKANQSQNMANSAPHRDNASGCKGVYMSHAGWRSTICLRGKRMHIGYFETKELAAEAYHKKAKELFGEFARAA